MRARRQLLVAVAALATTVAALAEPVESAFTARTATPASAFEAAALFAPRSVAPPALSGTAQEAQTLTASDGTWARGADAVTRVWLRCDATGGACFVIEGATAPTRTLAAADAGRRLRVRVSVTNAAGTTTVASAPSAVVAALPAPVNTVAPSIGGGQAVGQTLTVDPGQWSNGPVDLAYRWQRCTATCADVGDERTYEVGGDDAGATLKAAVTATNGGGSASATTAPTATITRATYTHVVCADPATGKGVAADGALPDAMTFSADFAPMRTTPAATRCAAGTAQTGARGIPLTTGSAFSTSQLAAGAFLQYRAPAATAYAGGTLYRAAQMGSTHWSWTIHGAATNDLLPSPRDEHCSWNFSCSARGTTTDPFAAANAVPIGPDSAVNGFTVRIGCYIPDTSWSCAATGGEYVRVYGARVTLRDTATPKVTAATGSLVAGSTVTGTATATLAATDEGAGLYRLRVRLDGSEVAAPVLDADGGRCADVNPANADPYEFATARPCPLALTARTVSVDTAAWPRGAHRLRVTLEDAGRNAVVLSDRTVTVA